MKKHLLGFILTLTVISCTKDGAAIGNPQKDEGAINNTNKDYTSFLAQTVQTFQGKLDGKNFSWSFGWNKFQGVVGYENGNGVCDSTDPVRILLFGLTSEGGGDTRFRLYSPKYNITSDAEFLKAFSVGKKKLGDFRTDFYLSINKDNTFYQTNGFYTTNEIEILKTEEFTDHLVKKLRVWFRLDAKLVSTDYQKNNTVLADGLIIAEFYAYKKGQ